MTAPTSVESLAGATISISAALPATYDAAGYASTDIIWTPIGKVENHGSHGGSKTVTKFTPVDTNTVEKVAGSIDYGTKSLTIGNLATDAGQLLLKTAFAASNTHYSFRVVYSDGSAVTPETTYLDALVTKYQYQDGAAADVRKVMCDLEICMAPVNVAPT
jgi:hypothetical protein